MPKKSLISNTDDKLISLHVQTTQWAALNRCSVIITTIGGRKKNNCSLIGENDVLLLRLSGTCVSAQSAAESKKTLKTLKFSTRLPAIDSRAEGKEKEKKKQYLRL